MLAVAHDAFAFNMGSVRFHVPKFASVPIIQGVNNKIPEILGNKELALIGLVDVTAKPFGADPSGRRDSTIALQQAIDFARDSQMVAYFPSGVYLISDTIKCRQDYHDYGKKKWFARKFPNVLLGSRKGVRPKIVLAARSPGFQSIARPKYMIHFYATLDKGAGKSNLQPNLNMNQMLVNIDLEVGKGNPGAVAIRHRGAEGSGIQETVIDVTYGFSGIEGGIGSGGSIADVIIIGGQIGLDMRETQPAPTITAVTLIGQRRNAILYGGRQTLTGVGIKIISKSLGPVIEGRPISKTPHHGQISLVDSEIHCQNPKALAISSTSSIYLNNVFIYGAGTSVVADHSVQVPGNSNGWVHIKEYANGIRPKKWKGIQFNAPIYVDGSKVANPLNNYELGVKPIKDLQMRHMWPPGSIPAFADAVNVKLPPYSAKADGITDDTNALQRAIKENKKIFLPKGYYKISHTLQTPADTVIFGVAKHLSTILATGKEGDFRSDSNPSPLLRTIDKKDGQFQIAFLELFVPNIDAGIYALEWRVGGNSVVRDVNFRYSSLSHTPPKNAKNKYMKNYPLVRLSGNGGGKWYNFNIGNKFNQGHDYRHLLIQGTTNPLSFYQLSAQHAKSDANIEIIGGEHIAIYGLKSEHQSPVLFVSDSDHIGVYGYGGNAHALEGASLFYFKNTPNFLVANLVDTPWSFVGKKIIAPWYMLRDNWHKRQTITDFLDRPVLYKRGHPNPANN